MRKCRILVAIALIAPQVAAAQVMRGKVTMADGSPPPQRAIIERICQGGTPVQETVAGKQGEFFWRVPTDSISIRFNGHAQLVRCVLRARLKDLESDGIDIQDPKVLSNLQLPTMVLRPANSKDDPLSLPKTAAKLWDQVINAHSAQQWAEEERAARDVVRLAPRFAPAWDALGIACQKQDKKTEARDAFRRAIAGNPTALLSRVHLARAEIALQLWPEAAKSAQILIEADTAHRYPEAYLLQGIAHQMSHNMDAARISFRVYLERVPNSPNSAAVKAQLEEPGGGAATEPSFPVQQALLEPPPEAEFTPGGEAWVPGGRKAMAAIARLNGVPRAEDFFVEYCRSIAAQTSPTTARPIPGYTATLQAYVGAVAALMDLGERKEDRAVFTLSSNDAKTPRILALLGWKVVRKDGRAPAVEPGDQPADGPRQQIPAALGIDEAAMQAALEAGRPFQFEILSEDAPLVGGASWSPILQSFATLPGGIAEAFVRDPRLARTYAGLGSMPTSTAATLVKRAGLRTLATAHAEALWRYGDTFRPPAAPAEPVWEKLAGSSPSDPPRFFEALLKADRGRLAGFYAAVSRADPAHRAFLLKDVPRAQRFYAWYRETDGSRAALLQEIPLDDAERVRWPGGRQAWSSVSASVDDETLWQSDLEALVAIARMERERGEPLDAESARLLARNFGRWRELLPFFGALPHLGSAEFQALEAFSAAAQKLAAQEPLMREWHSLAALIVLSRKAGSLDDEAAARAFGRMCRDLAAPDHSAKAVAFVRDLSGGGTDLDEAVVNGLLRLSGPGREAFERVREPQAAPRLGAPADVGTALSGIVYGAMLNPDTLLVHEDRDLLRKHTFAPQGALFSAAALNRSSVAPGSRFTGGFMKFDEASQGLARAGRMALAKAAAPSADAAGVTFRTNARLVEVYATVTDGQGRLVDGLRREQFTVLDAGQPMNIAAFENGTAALSCALLLDTSQSMDAALPALKSASLKLIGGLRPDDAVAVYSLNGGISELQPFTKDKSLAARVTLRAELGELTALYDGLVRVNRDLAARTGKKVIVVFTDGEDNNSTLSAATAILRAKTVGIPIYTIAQGHALGHPSLLKELSGMSQATGGLAFRIGSAAEIGRVFDSVLQDLLHGYLLAFQPAAGEGHAWRKIEVQAPGNVRAREGYFPE